MKKIACTLATLFTLLNAVAQHKNFTIKLTLSNLNPKARAYIRYSYMGWDVTDSAKQVNGNFLFSGEAQQTEQALVVIAHNGESLAALRMNRTPDLLTFYIEKGDIEIKGSDLISTATVSGTPTNDDARALAEAEKLHSSEAGKRQAEEEFIKRHPASFISLIAMQSYGGYYPEASELEPLYNNFTPELKASPGGKYYAALIAKLKLVAIGAKAPLFTENDKNGKAVSLESFRGKYLLIDFWASWCGPCRAENPNVVKAYDRFKDKNFTILGVSLDQQDGKEAWLNALAHDGLVWTQVSDLKYWQSEAAQLYGVSAIPQNFLLDPQGIIIAKNLKGEELVAKLNQIFGAATTAPANK